MDSFFEKDYAADLDRVDGVAKVTGKARYAAENDLAGMVYGVLVGSTIAKGSISSLDTKAAERAPGVLSVITHLNALKVPGYDAGHNPAKGPVGGRGLQVFGDAYIRFAGQPVAMVIADKLERAVHAASLVKVVYSNEDHLTNLHEAAEKTKPLEGARYNDYLRGESNAYLNAPYKVVAEYIMPLEVHHPMELHATTVQWESDTKVKVWDKTQGVKSTQRSIMQAFKLNEGDVQVNAQFVGGGFGSALRTWPHVIAALIGAKQVQRPLKLMLTRSQMFTLVGYRPYTIMKIGLGATEDGKLTGITHEAVSHTSNYEEFTEGTVNISRLLYACPNVNTRYKVHPLDMSTPTWMRGPGEATGALALECAMDELAYQLGIDPLELRIRNHADTDPQSGRPYTSKFLKEAYQMGAEKIGWFNKHKTPGSAKENGHFIGYGMGTGLFNANRGTARAAARLQPNGSVIVKSAVADSGPGTATAMVKIAAEVLGIPVNRVQFELGDSSLPPGPTQGGSTTTSTLGSAVHDVCMKLKKELAALAQASGKLTAEEAAALQLVGDSVVTKKDAVRYLSLREILVGQHAAGLEVEEESKASEDLRKYASFSYSVHFVKLRVQQLTGRIYLDQIVTVADSGKVISEKTARSQMIGGVVGGIGMALMEEGVIDQRYGRWVNDNFADYHVPVQADVPYIETLFVNKPDPIINPMGAKGMGEIALIGFAAAVANAVFHATGVRVRELPITVDKLQGLKS